MLCPWRFLQKNKYNVDLNNNDFEQEAEPSKLYTSSVPTSEVQKLQKIVNNEKCKHPEIEEKPTQPTKVTSACPFAPKFVKLTYMGNGDTLQDTLHRKATVKMPCQSSACRGALMTPKAMTRGPRDQAIPPEEILPLAIEFINQYYKSFKSPQVKEHLARVEEVSKEITDTGTYQLTTEELFYGAKQAWRNAPRCIGRIQWSNLKLFDARKCNSAQEMFDHICTHLRYASNDGNLRSTITVFPQRTDGKHDFRVWNSQLVRYAGYQLEDGSIIGDPASIEFTKSSARISSLLSMRDLGLRWYALPAVANMLLEVGGLEFPGCPFNGWYMGSEIGVRDFCDIQRYNVLEQVGKKMGLDTRKLSNLWKDQAVVEINIAVLHSFQKRNVTIMDHHTAAESFMKHMQNEFRLRGGCPADWVWIVPPISGSITPVFHQEMLNYILSPFYYYQPDPWKTHVWHDESRRPQKNMIKFKHLAKAVLFTSALMRKTMAQRVKATILFATETGKSETFARKLCTMFNSAFNTKVMCMDDYELSDLAQESLVLVVASTFGNGDSPGNGERFKKSLFTKKPAKLYNFRYSVFGLGSRMYPQFCAFAHAVDRKLQQLGAAQMSPTGEGDELSGQEESFIGWALNTFKVRCNPEPLSWGGFHKDTSVIFIPLSLSFLALSKLHLKDVVPMTLKSRTNLQSAKSSRSTILVELSCGPSEELQYLPGEHIGVFPSNQAELVSGLIKRLKDSPAPNQCVKVEVLGYSLLPSDWTATERIPACTLSEALTHFLDITTPPAPQLLKKVAQLATEESEKNRLLELSQVRTKWRSFSSPTILELLQEFPSIQCTSTFLLTQLMLLKPRYYSVSSSLDKSPRQIHLTVAVVNYRTKVQCARFPLLGFCFENLSSFTAGFHLPKNPSKPCILIGPGTGIAPFRSFWQQRLHDFETQACGMTLVFGCRHSEMDHIYKEETQALKAKGILKDVYTAYSREPGTQKTYVQDILREKLASKVYSALHEEKGHIYICGEIQMAQDVAETLKEVVAKQGNMSVEEAEEFLTELKNQKRYHEDIFGATFQK
uniref:Nitric oxide synthase n=1 Tax=Callorhinchus milii TaxID=7868 RepID=A0A4W3IBA7_CALMI